jgi:hypothetical protein
MTIVQTYILSEAAATWYVKHIKLPTGVKITQVLWFCNNTTDANYFIMDIGHVTTQGKKPVIFKYTAPGASVIGEIFQFPLGLKIENGEYSLSGYRTTNNLNAVVTISYEKQ